VLLTCGTKEVPRPLFEQLKPGGKLVIPVGEATEVQTLRGITKGTDGKREVRDLLPVRFVTLRRAEKTERKSRGLCSTSRDIDLVGELTRRELGAVDGVGDELSVIPQFQYPPR